MKNETIAYAKKLLEEHGDNIVFLDTETTGFSNTDEVIELGIVDINGKVLYEQQYRPGVEIKPHAEKVHGITPESLQDKPVFLEDMNELVASLAGKKIIIFNKEFDVRLMAQTADQCPRISRVVAGNGYKFFMQGFLAGIRSNTHCAMKMAANVFGPTSKYVSISLSNAAIAAGLNPSDYKAHSAIGDCLMTKDLFLKIASMDIDG